MSPAASADGGPARQHYTAELEHVRTPTLVLVGDQDAMTPPGGSVIISRRIPEAELRISKVKLPDTDPVFGASGRLLTLWA